MNSFKSELKSISKSLKGITLQLVSGKNVKPFYSLREFGFAVLSEESHGNHLQIRQAWTESGTISISTFDQLQSLIKSERVTGVSFVSYYKPVDFADYLRNVFTTND